MRVLLLLLSVLLVSILSGCASCDPCDPVVIEKPVTIYVPVPVPPGPLTLPLATERPSCLGSSSQIVKCIADYIQALRYEIEALRDEILSHNSAID